MREKVEERHRRILELVRARESVRVAQLAAELGISVETARRDVTALADVGRLRRVHGSVAWPTAPLTARDARLTRQAPPAPPSGLMLGMIVPAGDHFYRSVVRGARAAASAAGARLLVGITDYRTSRDAAQARSMIEAGVDGLLLTPSWGVDGPADEDAEQIAGLDVPAVLVERRIPLGLRGAELDRVSSDHAAGTVSAVRHLAALGHERIALLSRTTHSRPHILRGYRAAVDALRLPGHDLSSPRSGTAGDFATFEHDVDRLLGLVESEGVRAAIVHTDSDAMNLLQCLMIRGIRVPEDFAVVCYDDETAGLADVPLTAVAPAKHVVGETAVRLILRRIADPAAESSHISLLPALNIRESCGARPASGHPRPVTGS
ncbi:substrate-binding domain-containing protein [Streptomyces sp. NPDC002533]